MSLENEAYRRRVRDFLATHVPEGFLADRPDYAPPGVEACMAWEAAMHSAGLAGITWPEAYGGHGLTLREHLIANQEIGRLALPESVNSIGQESAGPVTPAFRTHARKRPSPPGTLHASGMS